MRNRFDQELEKLNIELIEMGCLIETAINMAVEALIKGDIEMAKKAINFDDEIDHQEREIERLCLKLLLQQQPVAADLRLISTALKIITDMERIGDQAADISELTIRLAGEQYQDRLENIKLISDATIIMVKKSIDAFVNRDLSIAREVIELDDRVDELFDIIKESLIALIREDKNNGEQAIDFLMIAKYYERIGDHAVNIAEWVVFSITGQHKNHKIV